ncbi:MAG TPA: cupredoxin domain-containing protein [Candidatus Saccharimonadales bacterium]|nr:cupredoxin domain-containing protein [Candidatus Saccharimonadales bacterium]
MNPDTAEPAPRRRTVLLIGAAVVILIALIIAGVMLRRHTKHAVSAAKQQAIIQIGPDGFTPATLTLKAGTEVVWRNADVATHAVASNPYPADTTVPGLHSKDISPGGSYTYTPTASGTIHYHDDIQPSSNGTITVIDK